MNIETANSVTQIESIRPLAIEWKAMSQQNKFGLEVDVDVFLSSLADMIFNDNSDLLMLMDGIEVVGIMGVMKFKSPFGKEQVANEHYLFVKKGHSISGGSRLIGEAGRWAKEHGCSHLILSASNVASRLHDKVCNLYERLGLSKFETSYIKEII